MKKRDVAYLEEDANNSQYGGQQRFSTKALNSLEQLRDLEHTMPIGCGNSKCQEIGRFLGDP